MLVHLHVKNLALIDEVEVDFVQHLNILTGETGAGKSIIIDSINSALGAKTSKDIIRSGCDYALIELLFYNNDKNVISFLREQDIPIENGELLISRKINSNGRSIYKINGQSATASMIKKISSFLIDIHGQHEHQSLLNKNKHLEILDQFCGKKILTLKEQLKTSYDEYINIKNKLDEQELNSEQRQREISFIEFECNEIESARLQDKEDVELDNRFKLLSNSREVTDILSKVYSLIGNEDNGQIAASDAIGKSAKLLREIDDFDSKITNIKEQLNTIDELINDINREIISYIDEIMFDEEEFFEIENRLNLINTLKSKYGNSLKEIEEYYNESKTKLEELINYEEYRDNLIKDLNNLEGKIKNICEKITTIRKEKGQEISKKIKEALVDLNFLDVQFDISVKKLNSFSKNGWDDVEFLISTNPGESLKPLSKIASGGELSRIMLAIKSILASSDEIETLIFDEIDVGISGRTAQKVSEKLATISKHHQVICITHLPQIASMADEHFIIEKLANYNKTNTYIKPLKEENIVKEIARLIGGVEITESILHSAKEMKLMANKLKKYK